MAPADDYLGSGPIRRSMDTGTDLPVLVPVDGFYAFRHDFGRFNGFRTLILDWDKIKPDWLVWAAVGEGRVENDLVAGKLIGLARCSVLNVAPGDGEIQVHVNMDFSSPIVCQVDFLARQPTVKA